jgi:hypothetical protein
MAEVDKTLMLAKGVLRAELFVGVVSSVTASGVTANLSVAGRPAGSHYEGGRYGRGEVGEFVLIEGQQSLLLGRIAEVRLVEAERRAMQPGLVEAEPQGVLGRIDLLGHLSMDDLQATAGVDAYPRLGDRIFAAPHALMAMLPSLMEPRRKTEEHLTLHLGNVDGAKESPVRVKPERLFGRHCAILGATGGGKSWTTARIIEECLHHSAKIVLIDATGEYCSFSGPHVQHCHLGEPVDKATGSEEVSLPPTCFVESDFLALFEPAGKVQGPKLRAALRSLRLAKLRPTLAPHGFIEKHRKPKQPVFDAELAAEVAPRLDDPRQEFDVLMLTRQLEQECVHPNGGSFKFPDPTCWGDPDEGGYAFCLSLFTRINAVLASPAFACVFSSNPAEPLSKSVEDFFTGDTRLLRICMSGVPFEFKAREVIANAIGRFFLDRARGGSFREKPTVVFVDEAHHFLGRHLGNEDFAAKLDAFELIAKEGRKYGLTLCLASQRPRDLTEDVLSQMGTLVVHRLTNDLDRQVVERACGEIDRAASAFLPNLQPGEAAIIGTDFPIPLTVRISSPNYRPISDGPDFQTHWVSKQG